MNSPLKIPPVYKPVITSDWHILFRPQKTGCYINDHTIIQAEDGRWHLVGITQKSTNPDPENERYFAHGSGGDLSLDIQFEEHGEVCNNGVRAWAPGAIGYKNKYYMFYGPSPTKLAVSPDINHWMENTVNLIGTPIDACHRDHMVLKIADNTWLMYAAGINEEGFSQISVLVSNDLVNWRFVQYAFRTSKNAPLKPAWGAAESPFVVYYKGWYYLSITYTDCSRDNYSNTLILRSLNPYDFGEYTGDNEDDIVVQKLSAHAPEYIYNPRSDKWYITTCGWYGMGIPNEGCVSIAEFEWVKE